jgi:YD repeat-containing protein
MSVSSNCNGNCLTKQHNTDNRRTVAATSQGEPMQTQYDAEGNVSQTTDANNGVTNEYYNLLNEEVLSLDPLGRIHFTVRGPTGEDLADLDGSGALTQRVYDADEQMVARIDPLGNTEQWQYDAAGNQVVFTDARGFATRSQYTALDQEAAVGPGDSFRYSCKRTKVRRKSLRSAPPPPDPGNLYLFPSACG